MSESYHDFSCIFQDHSRARACSATLIHLTEGDVAQFNDGMAARGLKPAFRDLDSEPLLENLECTECFVSFRVQLGGDDSMPKSFFELLHRLESVFVLYERTDDDFNRVKQELYVEGKKVSKKQMAELLSGLAPEARFFAAAVALPEELPGCIRQLGGYGGTLFGKPLFFHMAAQPDVFAALLDDMFASCDIRAVDSLRGDNVCHHMARQKSFDHELFKRFVDRGADPGAVNKLGERPLFLALGTGRTHRQCFNSQFILSVSNLDSNVLDQGGVPYLHRYVESAGIDGAVEAMIKKGGELNLVSPIGTVAWVARERSPAKLGRIDRFSPQCLPGPLTYSSDALKDIETAIRFRDDTRFDECLGAATETNVRRLYALCLRYAYTHGFLKLEEAFSIRISVDDRIAADDAAARDEGDNAYNYCWRYFDQHGFHDDFRRVMRRIIANSPADALRDLVATGKLAMLEAHADEDEFIALLGLLKQLGVDPRSIPTLDFRYSKKYCANDSVRVSKPTFHVYLRRLLDAGLSFCQVENTGYFLRLGLGDGELVDRLVAAGHPEALTGLILNAYPLSRKELLAFLLKQDLSSRDIQAAIWAALVIDNAFCNRRQIFDEDFLSALISSGLPLNQAYADANGSVWTPFSQSQLGRSFFSLDMLKKFLLARGVTKDASDAAMARG
jgi:hypothetical protein